MINYSPFTLKKLAFTIQELGDFGEKVKVLVPGEKVYVDGPYGAFTLKTNDSVAIMFIIGGIGVTPAMSIIRSLRDKADKRKVVMLFANKEISDVPFKNELDRLEKEMNLQVIHVMEKLPAGMKGEEGRIDDKLLEKYKIKDESDVYYYICGPTPLMDGAEKIILDWGVQTQNLLRTV
jgi:predicted ferric reductase